MNNESSLNSFPTKLNGIMGMVVKTWTKTNPEAVRAIFKWHTENENFLYKTFEEQQTYIKNKGFKGSEADRQDYIDNQVSVLRSNGMLPNKK